MFRRSWAAVIGLLAGVLVLVGGLVTFVASVGHPVGTHSVAFAVGAVLMLAVTAVLGVLMLLVVRPRFFWWPGRRLFNSIILVTLGVVTWILVGGFVLTEVGAALSILAGVLLPIEGALARALPSRRRWFSRRYW